MNIVAFLSSLSCLLCLCQATGECSDLISMYLYVAVFLQIIFFSNYHESPLENLEKKEDLRFYTFQTLIGARDRPSVMTEMVSFMQILL